VSELRFQFGANWSHFLDELDEERIATAERSLQTMLRRQRLDGLSFLDVGSGSGIFSLAARRLGARVHSFDYDPRSVQCTAELRRRFFPGDDGWRIEQGSTLDDGYLNALGVFDVVYSWGVLHHTGSMWSAFDNAIRRVSPSGSLFIAIYNDQGRASRNWKIVKETYNGLPRPLRFLLLIPALVWIWGPATLRDLVLLRPGRTWREYGRNRGMSAWRDVVDWVGGYPFEVATPEQVLDFCRARGLELQKVKTCGGGLGCNEFVFRRIDHTL
jgi:SAM-dependent methyltransferase